MTASKARTNAYLERLAGEHLEPYVCSSCGRESSTGSDKIIAITLRHIVADQAASQHQAKSALCEVRAEVARRYAGEDNRHLPDIHGLAVDPCPMVAVAALSNPLIPVALSSIICERDDFTVRRALWARYDELSQFAKEHLTPEFGTSGDAS